MDLFTGSDRLHERARAVGVVFTNLSEHPRRLYARRLSVALASLDLAAISLGAVTRRVSFGFDPAARRRAALNLDTVRAYLEREFRRAISLEPDPGPTEKLSTTYTVTSRLEGGAR